ncbi:hypothetical protein QR680_013457 [Steinernema hermaphroditum]|uniref:Uncharacterized protein n=1 Tax=Steinernema hermaphroditum TaxID=289476 RepID=A0AA39M2B0_9BILA|nr:hypothetical protein QR680_013457 [Steinernema hermaphroditum]
MLDDDVLLPFLSIFVGSVCGVVLGSLASRLAENRECAVHAGVMDVEEDRKLPISRTEMFAHIVGDRSIEFNEKGELANTGMNLLGLINNLILMVDNEYLIIKSDEERYNGDIEERCMQLDKLLAELKCKVDGLKNDEPTIEEIQAMKEHLAELRVDLENLNSELTSEMNRNNRVIEELNDSKKELQAKISSVEAKIASDNAAVSEQVNAIKKAEVVLAAERKQHKALVASLQKRIKYAEHITETLNNGPV